MTIADFFKEFIWIPILSTVIGLLLGIYIPKLIKYLKEKNQRRINKQINEIDISGIWNSFFGEVHQLQSEIVELSQNGREIKGTMKMDSRTYIFNGQFKNSILLGTYESENSRKDERGTIILRYINENMLSGYCTFVYDNKQVYNSSYVLTRNDYHQVQNGTFQFCNNCIEKLHCCCNDSQIDMPILLPFEAENISKETNQDINQFAIKKTNNLYQMRRHDNDDRQSCVFFVNNKCSIYAYRPIDCRLFPFDFKEINGEYWMGYYNNINVCRTLPKKKAEIDVCAHNLRPLLEIVSPYMSECSDPIFCERLKSQNFKELFPITKIIDDEI